VWKRHHRWSADGTWDRVLAQVLVDADAAGRVDWKVSADSTMVRADQHGWNVRREPAPSYLGADNSRDAGNDSDGEIESQDSAAFRQPEQLTTGWVAPAAVEHQGAPAGRRARAAAGDPGLAR